MWISTILNLAFFVLPSLLLFHHVLKYNLTMKLSHEIEVVANKNMAIRMNDQQKINHKLTNCFYIVLTFSLSSHVLSFFIVQLLPITKKYYGTISHFLRYLRKVGIEFLS